MKTSTLSKRPDQVAVITLNTPESPVNVISQQWVSDLDALYREVEADQNLRGCVLISGKKDGFVAGADLDGIGEAKDEREIEKMSRDLQQVFDRIANGRVPVVAAIHGAALGGGLETALACRARVATSDPKTVFALPEVQLGLLPGAAGTQRLPRLIGLRAAMPMLLTGKRIRAKEALRSGLIDELVAPDELLERAAQKSLTLSGGKARAHGDKISLLDRVLLQTPARNLVLNMARKQVERQTRGLYPAPPAILNCVETGLARGFDAGAAIESSEFAKLVVSPEAKSLIWIFHATRELKKETPRDGIEVEKLAVLGAGLMGQGIAAVSLPLSNVVIKDVTEKALSKARSYILGSLDKRARSGSLTAAAKDEQAARLSTTTDLAPLKGSALVIEAVFEDLALKQKLLAQLEAVVDSSTVIASNTSALPIGKIAEHAKHPERILGMHYFSPVPKMPLLEIVVTPQTSKAALATAHAYGVAQGKTVIVVRDQPGFYTTRILAPLLNEAMLLLEEGAGIEEIDRAMKDFGFPVGPVALLDEVGIDVGAHVAKDLGAAFGSRWSEASRLLEVLHAAGFAGRKNGRGFYTYPPQKKPKKGAKKTENAYVYVFTGAKRKKHDRREIADRVALVMANEAVHCLEEGVIRCARDGDVGAILGLGFPPFRGGPFHHLDALGAKHACARLEELAAKYGKRFTPAPRLKDLAQSGERFY